MPDPTVAFYETLADDFEDAITEARLVKLRSTNRDIIAAALRHYAEKPAHDRAMRIARVVLEPSDNELRFIGEYDKVPIEHKNDGTYGDAINYALGADACAAIIALAEAKEPSDAVNS